MRGLEGAGIDIVLVECCKLSMQGFEPCEQGIGAEPLSCELFVEFEVRF